MWFSIAKNRSFGADFDNRNNTSLHIFVKICVNIIMYFASMVRNSMPISFSVSWVLYCSH